MRRTAPGRRIELNGTYAGRPVVEQSEAERAEAVASEWNRTAPNRPDVDRAMQQQYSGQSQPDTKPPSEPDQPARQTKGGRLVKGSPEAKEHMARLRERRGKAKSTTDDTEQSNDDE